MMVEITSEIRQRPLTEGEVAKYSAMREKALREKPQVLERLQAEGLGPASWEDLQELLVCIRLLREERGRQGLTCEEVARRAKLKPEEIEELEAERDLNPRLATLTRYAHALGHRLALVLAVRSSMSPVVTLGPSISPTVSSPSSNV